jgi:hypothetical protein
MPKWVKRLREIAARNPDALPVWLRRPSHDKVWYRISWQTGGGIRKEDAARPVIMMLDWLAQRDLLTRQGRTALKSAQGVEVGFLILAPSMVLPTAAAFLEAYWEKWWESNGINLTVSSACADDAKRAIDECWAEFGKVGQSPG